MIVSFPFTFTFSYPGLPNPFSPNYGPPESHSPSRPMLYNQIHTDQTTPRHSQGLDTMPYPQNRFTTLTPPPHTASSIVSKPPNLKRGWEPAFVEPSRLTATLASSNGYLDTPAKYREIASAEPEHDQPEGMFFISPCSRVVDLGFGLFFRVLMVGFASCQRQGPSLHIHDHAFST